MWITCMSTVVKVQKFSISITDANLLNILVGKMVATCFNTYLILCLAG